MNLTARAHQQITNHLPTFERSIDATVGNGFDTLFLAQHTTRNLYCFEIQHDILDEVRNKMQQQKHNCLVEWIKDGHQHMAKYIPHSVDVIMFNLGYLPGGDKNITTQKATTLMALDASLTLLKPGGLLSILCYTGHPGGKEEAQAVTSWMDQNPCRLLDHQQSNHPQSPVFYLLQK